jgi:hypothetical protein
MVRQIGPESTQDQIKEWNHMAGWLISCPDALTNIRFGLYPAHANHGVMDGTWNFHTQEPDDENMLYHYQIAGLVALDAYTERNAESDLYEIGKVLNHPDRETARPRDIMRHGLLGVPRPGRLRDRELPIDELYQAVGVVLPTRIETIRMRIDRQFGNSCAGENEAMPKLNHPSFSNYDYSREVPSWLTFLHYLADESEAGRLVAGLPQHWHTEHQDW